MTNLYKEALLNLNFLQKIFYYTGCLKITCKKAYGKIYVNKINTYNIFSYSYRYYNPLIYFVLILYFISIIIKNIILGFIVIIEDSLEFIRIEILNKNHIFHKQQIDK